MDQPMSYGANRRGQIVFGVFLIVGGLLLLFTRHSIWNLFALWPLILIGLGVHKLVGACCAYKRREGFWLLGIGSWLGLNEFTVLRYHDTWPLLLVVVGALIAWEALAPPVRCQICAEGRCGH